MQPPSKADYYVSLGVQQSATAQEIRQAYRALALKYHPDKQGQGVNVDAKEFRKIQEAYEALRDESKRAQYDEFYVYIQREWVEYRRWQKTEDPFEQKRRLRAEERQKRAMANENARMQTRAWGNAFESGEKDF
ncbi:chaperone protein DnaJ [Colletotrichum spaethianum]|uniref:Chaperone protein DnaJ n=1 Tax=Colletotrichum spaethianum TaxID=700344 RepID=A0AA37L1S6_9PEZI|nr:chaperone protein DnaJ [Colletotrichum spaethianum]GKT40378.1 chaperone protein DnaJ [Colletotrichum spaethianum]